MTIFLHSTTSQTHRAPFSQTKTSITNETFHVVDAKKKYNEDTTKFHLLGLTFIDLCDSFDEDEMFFLSLKTNSLGFDVPLVFFASISQILCVRTLSNIDGCQNIQFV